MDNIYSLDVRHYAKYFIFIIYFLHDHKPWFSKSGPGASVIRINWNSLECKFLSSVLENQCVLPAICLGRALAPVQTAEEGGPS